MSFCHARNASIQSSKLAIFFTLIELDIIPAGARPMPIRIDWEGLIVGFESRSHQITHFFDRETGDVEQALVRDADRHQTFADDPRYVALPRDAGERTRGDLEAFLSVCEDDACRRALGEALVSAEPAASFRQALLR